MLTKDKIIEQFSDHLKAKGRQTATRESYCRDAKLFLDYLAKQDYKTENLEPDTLVKYQQHLAESEKERINSIRRKVIGIRQFFRFLVDIKVITSSPFDHVPIPERYEVVPTPLNEKKFEKLLDTLKKSLDSLKISRDYAILNILAFEGCKANELINLRWNDLQISQSIPSISIRGLRSRTIEILPKTKESLVAYKDLYTETKKKDPIKFQEDYVFIAFKGKDGSTVIPKMTRHGLKFMLYEIGEKMGLKTLNTEALRHYAISNLILSGKSPEEIMHHLGLRRLGVIAKHIGNQL